MDAPTILLAEDQDDVRVFIEEILTEEGYHVVIAANGQEALDYLERHPAPQLILLDLMMPVMDGWALRRALLADPRWATIPVVITSGIDREAQDAASLAAAAYLTKPFELMQLLQVVRTQTEVVMAA